MKQSRFAMVAALFALALCLFTGPAEASLTICDGDTCYGSAKELNFGGGLGVTKSGGVHTVASNADTVSTNIVTSENLLFQTTMVANGRPSASTQVASSSTNLAPTSLPWGLVLKNIGGAGGKDNTDGGTRLPNSVDGHQIAFLICSVSPNGTWIITPNTSKAFTSVTFDAIGDMIDLLYVDDTIGWIPTGANNMTIAPVKFVTAGQIP